MALRGRCCEVGGEGIAQPAGVRRGCVGERKCSGRACRCGGASEDLRRGMHRAACGRASGLRGGAEVLGEGVLLCGGERRASAGRRKCSGRACRCAGASEGLRRGMGCEVGGRASGLRGGAEVLGKGVSLCRGERRSSAGKVLWGGGECIAQPAGVCRGCVGERKCSGRACRCAGASEGLRRGMGCEVGGECIAQPAGVRRCAGAGEGLRRGMGREDDGNASRSRRACVGTAWACVGAAWGSGSAREGCVAVQGRAEVFGGEWVVRSAGMHRALRACVGAAWGSGSAREGRVAVRGRAEVFGGEWVVRSAGLTHIRRSSTRARVLLYIRPPCSRREIAAMGRKGVPCEYPSPAE